jgi:predicted DNA-binding protein (MmcQ/YjbR family)
MRDQFVSNGDAEPHHIFPKSGWVSLFLRAESDVERAIQLLRASFDLAVSRQNAQKASEPAKKPHKGRSDELIAG